MDNPNVEQLIEQVKRTHRSICSEENVDALLAQGFRFIQMLQNVPSTDPEDVYLIGEPVTDGTAGGTPITLETLCADAQVWVEEKWFQQAP